MFPPKTDLKPAHDTFFQGVLQGQAKGMTGTSSDGLLPVKHTGHLKVPPMPSKLCSIRWHWSLAGESNVWLQSLHSWFSPSSAGEIKRKVKFTTALTKRKSNTICELEQLFVSLSSGKWMPLSTYNCWSVLFARMFQNIQSLTGH